MSKRTEVKRRRLLNRIASFFKSITPASVVEWSEANIYLPPTITERAGMFSTEDCAYLREPLECFRAFDVQELDLLFATQVGKTTLLMIGLAYSIDQNPRRTMVAFPSDALARNFVKSRWEKILENCEALNSRKPIDSDDMTNFSQMFDSCQVFFTGVGSASKVSSEPVALLIEDEIDKFPLATERESDARSLAEERVKSYTSKLIVRSSTPTTEAGNISQSFALSDQRYYFIPCPHCKEKITLDFKNVRWYTKENPEDDWNIELVASTAVYVCPKCNKPISENAKRSAIRKGEWRATNPNAEPFHRGYHLNSLYSPTLTTADVAVQWVKSKEETDKLQNFINSWLAEAWEDRVIETDQNNLSRCERDYAPQKTIGKVRVITVDVQRVDLRYNVRAYADGNSYLVDWGTAVSWEDIDALQTKYDARHVGVDINYREREVEVVDAIFARSKLGWFAVLGAPDKNMASGLRFKETTFNPYTGRNKKMKYVQTGIRQLTIRSSVYYNEIAKRRDGQKRNWFVYPNVEKRYKDELFAMVCTVKKQRGKTNYVWTSKGRAEHQFDLECYHLAIADWLKLYNQIKPQAPKKPTLTDGRLTGKAEYEQPKKRGYIPIDQR